MTHTTDDEFYRQQARQLAKAIAISAARHEGQFDKGGRPYILHPLKVMYFVEKETGDLELMQMSVLHDVIEDTFDDPEEGYAYLESEGFSPRVIAGLRLLSKKKGQPHAEYKAGILGNYDTVRVKKQDVRHNSDIRRLKGLTEKDFQRTQQYHSFYTELLVAQRAFERGVPATEPALPTE